MWKISNIILKGRIFFILLVSVLMAVMSYYAWPPKFAYELAKILPSDHIVRTEFDNFKKRTFQEKQDSLKYEGQDIVQSILPIIDDLNRVLEIKEIKKNDSIYKGINLVIDKFNNVLENNNIVAYESKGKAFNPDLHEALMTKKVKNKKNIIVDVYQSGYKYHDIVIRHAKVIVGEYCLIIIVF